MTIIYTFNIFGSTVLTTVTSSPFVIERWLCTTLHTYRGIRPLVVGMAIHWSKPPSTSSTVTLQICMGQRCFIIQLSRAQRVPYSLRLFLNHPGHVFVSMLNYMSTHRLRTGRHRLVMGRPPLDVRNLVSSARGINLMTASFGRIVEVVLGFQGVSLRSYITTSNWEARELSREQVQHATLFAYAPFIITETIAIERSLMTMDLMSRNNIDSSPEEPVSYASPFATAS